MLRFALMVDSLTFFCRLVSTVTFTNSKKRDIKKTPSNTVSINGAKDKKARHLAMTAILLSSRDKEGVRYKPTDHLVAENYKSLMDCAKRVHTHLVKYLMDVNKYALPHSIKNGIDIDWAGIDQDIKTRYSEFLEMKAYEECGF